MFCDYHILMHDISMGKFQQEQIKCTGRGSLFLFYVDDNKY